MNDVYLKWYSEDKAIYGLAVYNILIEYFFCCLESNTFPKWIDIRIFHSYYEHMKLFRLALTWMRDEKIIINKEIICKLFHKLEDVCLITRNLVIKYNILNTIDIFKKIKGNLVYTKEQEEIAIKLLIEQLK